VEGKERVEEVKWCKYCLYMYVNGKMRSVETISGMEGSD
jgi:hypothetical protein